MEWHKSEFTVSDDPKLLNVDFIHDSLVNKTHWGKAHTRETIERTIKHSFCFGLYHKNQQIGYARAITDFTVFSYLLDVFVLEEYRNKKLGHFLLECMLNHPMLKNLKWVLKTTSSHTLYEDLGFKKINNPDAWMERFPPQN